MRERLLWQKSPRFKWSRVGLNARTLHEIVWYFDNS
jgi:hypothetical protein